MFLCISHHLKILKDAGLVTSVRRGTWGYYSLATSAHDRLDASGRLRAAGHAVDIEMDETCCYAVQNKVWATDPDGRRWETYFVIADTEERDNDATTCCGMAAAVAAASPACC